MSKVPGKASNEELKRLVFIKYLYMQAIQQSKMYQPMSAASILTFHDVVELYLNLVLDHLGITLNDTKREKLPSFMGYIPTIGNEYTLKQTSCLDRLNTARNSLKHHGVLPDISEIDSARNNVAEFFKSNTNDIFKIEFDKISIAELIQHKTLKESIRNAENYIEKDDRENALIAISTAYFQFIELYGDSYLGSYIKPESLDQIKYLKENDRDICEHSVFIKDVTRSINNIYGYFYAILSRLIPLSLGFDFQKLQKFYGFIPQTRKNEKGEYEALWLSDIIRPNVTKNDLRFCLNFVIECAIKMQDIWSDKFYDEIWT